MNVLRRSALARRIAMAVCGEPVFRDLGRPRNPVKKTGEAGWIRSVLVFFVSFFHQGKKESEGLFNGKTLIEKTNLVVYGGRARAVLTEKLQ